MTAARYAQLYREARANTARLTLSTMRQLRRTYQDAARLAASRMASAELAGYGELTSGSWAQLNEALSAGARKIQAAIAERLPLAVKDIAGEVTHIDEVYLVDSLARAGVGLERAVVKNLFIDASDKVLRSLVTRVYSDGYTFSQRVWRAGEAYQAAMKRVLTSGLGAGLDVKDVASGLTTYVREGREAVVHRWGKLVEGSKEFAKRIGNANVDANALRLVRSELYASLQEAARLDGQVNPGCTGWYDWVRTLAGDWDCDCDELAAGSPYTEDTLPAYPHPNCHPAGTMILTIHGYIPIENILPGDLVISHDGTINSVSRALRTLYDGELLSIRTNEGEINVTPEHPLFSCGSWLPAHDLETGYNITRVSVNFESFPLAKSISGDRPSVGNKKGRFFRLFSLLLPDSLMPVPAIDFHGELYILKSEIDVVTANRKIGEWPLSATDQGIIQQALIGRPDLSGIRLRYAGAMFIRLGSTPDGIMCGSNINLESIRIASTDGFGKGERLESNRNKIAIDTDTTDSEALSYFLDREIFIAEQPGQHIPVKINSSSHNSAIVSVYKKYFKGIVFNLTVENTHSFIANGFASHNCACFIHPRLRDGNEFVKDLKAWADGESVDYLDRWHSDYYRQAA